MLNHATFGIPGGRGLFTPLWIALMKAKHGYVQLTKEVKQAFSDFHWLFSKIVNRPVNVAQLVHIAPGIIGFSDACKHGAGGVWIILQNNRTNRYFFWYITSPLEIVKRFHQNLLSINDLEMVSALVQWLILEHLLPTLQFVSVGIQCDNSSSILWSRKFTALSLIAGYLLRVFALSQQICRLALLLVAPIAGVLNIMADVASRFHSDKSLQNKSSLLLTYFSTYFQTADLLDRILLETKIGFKHDVIAAEQAIESGVVVATPRTCQKYWSKWCHYAGSLGIDPLLQCTHPFVRDIAITAFAVRVRSGHYGKKCQIAVQGVSDLLSAISKTIELTGLQSPLYRAPNKYNLQIEPSLKGWHQEDPPAIPQLAIPITVLNFLHSEAYATDLNCPKTQAIADLAQIAFYYLLQVGEYTKPWSTTYKECQI